MKKLTVGSCFSGIGGLELGLEWTGSFETRWQIENDAYAAAVLAKHWPVVTRYSDITAVDPVRLERVDVICGGFPCQDVSLAGKRAGLQGNRTTLWGEMYRLICEVKPRWVVAENVPGLFSSDDGRFFGNILRDLAGAGYDAEWGVLSAAGVGAPHIRRRVFIVSYPKGLGTQGGLFQPGWGAVPGGNGDPQPLADAAIIGCDRRGTDVGNVEGGQGQEQGRVLEPSGCGALLPQKSWWATEPDVGRVAYGVPSREDRLRCLGNAVVPQVAQKIGERIARAHFAQT